MQSPSSISGVLRPYHVRRWLDNDQRKVCPVRPFSPDYQFSSIGGPQAQGRAQIKQMAQQAETATGLPKEVTLC